MPTRLETITVPTTAPIELVDITAEVRSLTASSGVRNGVLTLISRHTTAYVNLNESEHELTKDMIRHLEQVVPQPLLELPDLYGQGGLRHEQLFGRTGEVAAVRDGLEVDTAEDIPLGVVNERVGRAVVPAGLQFEVNLDAVGRLLRLRAGERQLLRIGVDGVELAVLVEVFHPLGDDGRADAIDIDLLLRPACWR